MIRATTACTFSTSQLPKVVRHWCVFVHFDFKICFAPQRRAIFSSLIWPAGSAPAALASLLFRPSGATNHWKKSVSRLSYLFAHLHLLSSYSFSSTLLSSNLPLLSASSLLCFSSVHIVGSLTSKLPSNINIYVYRYREYFLYIISHEIAFPYCVLPQRNTDQRRPCKRNVIIFALTNRWIRRCSCAVAYFHP